MKSKFDFKGNYVDLKVSNNKIIVNPSSRIFGIVIILIGLFCIYVGFNTGVSNNYLLFFFILILGIAIFFLGMRSIFIKDRYEFLRDSKKYKKIRKYLIIKKDLIKTGNFKDFESLKLTFGISGAGVITWYISLKTKKGENIDLLSKDIWSVKKNAEIFANAILFFSEFFGIGYHLKINERAKHKYFSSLLKNDLNLDKAR